MLSNMKKFASSGRAIDRTANAAGDDAQYNVYQMRFRKVEITAHYTGRAFHDSVHPGEEFLCAECGCTFRAADRRRVTRQADAFAIERASRSVRRRQGC
jgi:hypothetical protein